MLSVLICLALFVQCSNPKRKCEQQKSVSKSITVGVFNGNGGAQSCIRETVAAIRLDPEMSIRMITSADITGNVLDILDAISQEEGNDSTRTWEHRICNALRIL